MTILATDCSIAFPPRHPTPDLPNGQGADRSRSSHARIGFTDIGTLAGNSITGNTSNGIILGEGSSALIAGNTIQENRDPYAAVNLLNGSSAKFIGKNQITGNAGWGMLVQRASIAVIGDTGWGVPIDNVITANGLGGIEIYSNSSVVMNDATVAGNTGYYGVVYYASSYYTMDVTTSITGGVACY
jgi:parallel beta-helix repeat protein